MGKDSSEIRREIEETRARMGDTVEALGYKADVPARVKDAVSERVDTVKGTIGSVVESVKDTATGAVSGAGDAMSAASDAVGGATGKVGSALGGARRSVSQTLNDTTGRVQDTTNDVRNTVQNTLSNTVGSVTDKLPGPDDVRYAARRCAGIVQENPLGLALGALAVGFLAGLAAPITDIEREKVGPLRDDLVERAKSVTSDALEHGKQVLQETAQEALDAAQQQGLQVLSEAKGETVHQDDKTQEADSGGASAAGMPRDSSRASTTPRAWATPMALLLLRPRKSSSSAASVTVAASRTAASARWICSRRAPGRPDTGVRMVPQASTSPGSRTTA